METQHDYSYGVIPFFKEEGDWKVFLIHQYGYGGDVYWTFPKGHAEGEETPLQAALRELYEETNIAVEQLREDHTYTQEYSFMTNDVRINKVVIYYLGFAVSQHFEIQEDEVKEAGWFSIEKAIEMLSFDPAKDMLKAVVADLPKQ